MNEIVKCANKACGLIVDIGDWRNVPTKNPRITDKRCPRCNSDEYFNAKPGEVEKEKSGAQLIALERNRQIKIEGWTPEHDDIHTHGEMRLAAVAYAYYVHGITPLINSGYTSTIPIDPPDMWPWEKSWWKPSDDPRRNLVKAGALIAAEIDRLRRAEQRLKAETLKGLNNKVTK